MQMNIAGTYSFSPNVPPPGYSFMQDNFEEGTIFQVAPAAIYPRDRDLWNLYTDWNFIANAPIPGLSTTDIVTTSPHTGTKVLHNRFKQELNPNDYASNWQFELFTYCTGLSAPYTPDGWENLYQMSMTDSPSSYQQGRINRMRIWMKIPVGAGDGPYTQPGFHNMEHANHLRERSEPQYVQESNNWHFYHFYFLEYSEGRWEQIIVDTQPQHQRSHPGDEDLPDQLHPSSVTPALTYFDLQDSWYLDFWEKTKLNHPWPAGDTNFYIDDIELFEDTSGENIRQVASLHGVYLPGSNKIRVGWCRLKSEVTVSFNIKYSKSRLINWTDGIDAPGGLVTPDPDSGPYSCMKYESTAIDVSGTPNWVWIAIKPQGATLFRQIQIPTV